jgi:hypothetical protein
MKEKKEGRKGGERNKGKKERKKKERKTIERCTAHEETQSISPSPYRGLFFMTWARPQDRKGKYCF